jgi:hypothetical protein
MWGWLGSIFDWATNAVGGTVVPWIRDLIHGVWGWLSTLFGHVGNAWHDMFRAGKWIHLALAHFGLEALATVWDIIFKRLPKIVTWAWDHIQNLWHFATHIYRLLLKWVENLIHRIEVAIHDAIMWVTIHIWRPLKADFLNAWHWITHEGARVFYYITHPDKLAELVFDSLLALLERESWAVSAKLGKFFLALIHHNLKRFVLLIEDILMAVF